MHTNFHEFKKFGVQALACLAVALGALAWSGVAFCGEIHDAVKAGDVEKVKALLKANPELVNSKDDSIENKEFTPLHFAAYHGRPKMVELLLANKADINAKDKNGKTPLHLAVFVGSIEVAEVLLANKADVTVKDKNGETPLFATRDIQAQISSNLSAQESEREKARIKNEIIALLRKHGAKE